MSNEATKALDLGHCGKCGCTNVDQYGPPLGPYSCTCRGCGYAWGLNPKPLLPPAPPPLSVGIAKLSLQPGDVLVVTVPENALKWGDTLVAEFAKRLPPGVHVMWKAADIGLTVLRAGSPVTPEVDTPLTVEGRP